MLKAISGFFRCLLGIHCVPKHWAYEDLGAIFAGGVCPRCGVLKAGKFLCNTWNEIIMRSDGVIELHGYDVTPVTGLGYEIRGNIDGLIEEFQERKEAKKSRL